MQTTTNNEKEKTQVEKDFLTFLPKKQEKETRYIVALDPEFKEIIDKVHSIRGGSRKEFIQSRYLYEYNILMNKENSKKREVVSEGREKGLIERFDHLSGDYIKYGEDRSNYMKFAYWFNGLLEEEKEVVLNGTIEEKLERWYRVMIAHGSLSGNPYKTILDYLEERGVWKQIQDYSIIAREKEAFEEKEQKVKELVYEWSREFREENNALFNNDNHAYKKKKEEFFKQKREEFDEL